MASDTTETIEREIQVLLEKQPLSARSMRHKLRQKGFASAEITKALKKVNWREQAALVAKRELHTPGTTPDILAACLAGYGFSTTERQAAIRSLDWKQRILETAVELLEDSYINEEDMREDLESDGYSPQEIQETLKKLNIDWDKLLDEQISSLLNEGYSRKGIVLELSDFGDEATRIRRNLRKRHIDWNDQALRAANLILLETHDPEEIAEELAEDDFTASQIDSALKKIQPDSLETCLRTVDSYLQSQGISEKDLREDLKDLGFSKNTIQKALHQAHVEKVDWNEAALGGISSLLDPCESRREAFSFLRDLGYTKDQISYAFAHLKVDWKMHAYNCARQYWEASYALSPERMRAALKDHLFTNPQVEYAMTNVYGDVDDAECAYRFACRFGVYFPSRKMLQTALLAGGFSSKIVKETLNNLWFDWHDHALRQAKALVAECDLRDQVPYPVTINAFLTDQGFTKKEQENIVSKLSIDWGAIAAEVIEEEKNSCCGLPYILSLLRKRKFSEQDIQKGLELSGANKINWKEQAHYSLARALEAKLLEPDQIRRLMHDRGLSDEEIEYAFTHTVIPKNVDRNQHALEAAQDIADQTFMKPEDLRRELKHQYFSEEQIAYVMDRIQFNLPEELLTEFADLFESDMPQEFIVSILQGVGLPDKYIYNALNKFGRPTDQ